MSEQLFILIFVLVGGAEFSIMYTFLYRSLGLKARVKMIYFIVACVVQLIVTCALALMWYDAAWRPFFGFVLTMTVVFIFFKGSIMEKLAYGVLSMIMIVSGDIISSFVVVLLNDWGILNPEGIAFQFWTAAFSVVMKLLLFVSILHFTNAGKLYMPTKYWIGLTVMFSIILVANFVIVTSVQTDKPFQPLIFAIGLGLLMLWYALYFVFYFILRYYAKVNEANLLAVQNEMFEKYIQQKQDADQMLKILSHDLKHSMVKWKSLAAQSDDQEAEESIEMYEQLIAKHKMIDVGNDIANAIINEKMMAAKRDEINFTVKGSFYEDLQIDKIDFCSLLGNLIDNALEAAVLQNDKQLRRAELSINRKGRHLLLMLENGYAVEPVVKDKSFVTHKKNRGVHGIGMVSIGNVVNKYDGVMDCTYQNNIFKTDIMIRCYEM